MMPVEPMPTGEYRALQQSPVAPQQRSVFDYGRPDDALAPGSATASAVGDFRLLAMLIGAAVSGGVAATNPARGDQWTIFVLVAALLGAASGEAFGFGLSRWQDVKRIHPIVKRQVWLSVLSVLLLAIALIGATPYLVGPTDLTWRGVALSAVAIVGGLSTAATLAAIKQVVSDPLPGTPGRQLDVLLGLRRMCSRLLSQLGLLVLLVMGVNATAVNWGKPLNPGVVIFSGVVASFVVGAMYVPTASMLRRRGVLYVERHFSLTEVGTAELITAAEDRGKLEKLLSLDQTTFGELKAGLVVLSPVVIGLIASIAHKIDL